MVFSFVLLAALVLGLIVIPQDTKAQYGGYISSIPAATVRQDNPEPIIKSINPSASNVGVGTKTVNIIGEGFIPSSVARVNGSNRPTTFIDSSHLLVQITGNDTYLYQTNGGFYITVFNGPPGGGYSNAVFFKINKTVASPAGTTTNGTQNDNANNTYTNFTDAPENNSSDSIDGSNLSSNAIFGENGIFHSRLIQWIFAAILVLVAVILVRRIYGADKKYHAVPLKHD
ncbi:MAG: Cell surface receptor IPT/TIG domain protein [Parcubacteria group bacterium GW2011_GWA2_40_37]|nr:MAG: Cell surface receptor IPT/TIG domain protein [Parcubacteria group bacterium GW2011_GWA2_40_37]